MIKGINHITLAVSDLETSFTFYKDTLGCRPLARWQRGAYFLAGDLWLCLSLDQAARTSPLPDYSHLAFTVENRDFETWRSRLRESQVSEWKENTSEGSSLYFLDPDGYKLELHNGDWRSRIAATKISPYDDMEFFV